MDKAIDNLWNTTNDVFVYTTIGYPAKMVKKASSTLMGKRNKLQGYITYFLPKDKDGKMIGKPQRFLRLQRLGKTTDDYVSADSVTPYYEDIVKNKSYWTSLGGANIVSLAQSKLSGINEGSIASNFLGDLFKPKNKALSIMSDPKVSIVDAETMAQAYKESGSRTPFRDWANSEGGKGILNEITKLANAIVNKGDGSGLPIGNVGNVGGSIPPPPKSETKILGMSPVTFGIVAIGTIAVASFVAYKIIKSKQVK